MLKSSVIVLAIVALVGLASVASAAPPPTRAQAAALKRAKEHFKKGQAAHAAGKYDEAIVEYQAAYDASPLPDLLFNLAQVQRLKGDSRQALDSYLKYLEQAPNGRGADESRQWIASLSKDIRQDEEQRRAKQAEEEQALRDKREAERTESHAEEMSGRPGFGQPFSVPLPVPAGQGLKTAGLIAGGVGIAGLAIGSYFSFRSKSLSDKQNDITVWDPSIVADGKAANRNAIIAFSVGGAALATGGVLYYLGTRAARSSERPALVVVPAGTSLVVAGQY